MKKIVSRSMLLFVLLFLAACGKQVSVDDLKANDWLIEELEEVDMIASFSNHVVSFRIDPSSYQSTATNEWEALGEEFAKSMLEEFQYKFEYTLEGNIMTWENDGETGKYTVTKEDKNIILTPTKDNEEDKKLVLKPYDKSKTATSSTSSDSTTTDKDATDDSSLVDITDNSTELSGSDDASGDSAFGKRSNPVPLDNPITFDTVYYDDEYEEIDTNISLTISNVVRGEEAYNYMISMDEYNEPAPEGKEWVVFDAELTVNKGSQDEPYRAFSSFIPVSSTGEEVNQESYSYLGNEEFGNKDLYEGGTDKGKVALLVPIGDDTLIEFNDFTNRIFFKLQ
ncbi:MULTISPECIES: hypothetical protein [Enterococcus]|uniref:hypothetical protein n=1 Tax=Enterococcus TaxID=1350 RepID=UPI0003020B01|nr:hypothetical protein [Enterococcus mundtii]MDB7101834.1 hypothetical protein [Enterococcus mundtii]MDV7744989.1 hypothetical protein [Enterococcus mundtii]